MGRQAGEGEMKKPTEQEFKERTAYWDGYRLGFKDGECDGRRSERQNFTGCCRRVVVILILLLLVIVGAIYL